MKLYLLLILFIPGFIFAQFEKPLPGYTLFYGGISFNPFDKELEYLQGLLRTHDENEINGTLILQAGYATGRNFDKRWGFGINIPLMAYLLNENLPENKPIQESDDDIEVGNKNKYGIGIGLELIFVSNFDMKFFSGLESNYFLGTRYKRSVLTNEIYAMKNSINVIPTVYAGIRYSVFELSWNYVKGVTLKAGYPLNKSPF